MKLTWFANTAFRIHIGGQILVVDPQAAPHGVDAAELLSGADQVVTLDGGQPAADLKTWKPRPRERLLDAGETLRPVQVWSAAPDSLLIEADEDMPLLLLAGMVPDLGRWAEKAVVILAGQGLAERGERLLERTVPRLIALAGSDDDLDSAFARLPARLDGAGLIALAPGLAVEV